ncbi:hypothetical protein Ahy_A04g017964 [Arachis hypogaea]|uniref:C3H1-type domain-containing protein n=1 Tax=Arachis hypogaea TaxID=3818 RepID=A0A445DCK6_ARAHY|nr:hypothetical protein Ahy_A04g017964 [Arachis hypogaea]
MHSSHPSNALFVKHSLHPSNVTLRSHETGAAVIGVSTGAAKPSLKIVPVRRISFVWLGSPVSNLVLEPILGYYSSRCTCKLGRHCPFIHAGAVALIRDLLMIGFSADIGYAF